MKKLLVVAISILLSQSAAYADGDNKVEKKAKINREEAKAIALKEVPGTIIDIDIEKRKSGLFWEVDIKPTDGKVAKKEVKIDANTGKVLSVEDDNDDDAKD